MKTDAGFYKRRRGILEHLEAGTISLLDLAIHDYLNLRANLLIGSRSALPPGVCITSSAAIHAVSPRQISERAIRRSLEHLEKIRWIKRWNQPGKHGNYAVLVCRASVHDLSGNEYRINGEETIDWKDPKWESVRESAPLGQIADTLLSADREVRTEKGEKRAKPGAAKATAPADPRFQVFVEYAHGSFQVKHGGQAPYWGPKDFKNLKTLLEKNKSLSQDELQRRWTNYLGSTEPFTVKQGDSLAHFCAHFDSFINGPLSGGKEKLGAEDAIRRSLGNSGLDENGNYKRPN